MSTFGSVCNQLAEVVQCAFHAPSTQAIVAVHHPDLRLTGMPDNTKERAEEFCLLAMVTDGFCWDLTEVDVGCGMWDVGRPAVTMLLKSDSGLRRRIGGFKPWSTAEER